MLNHVKVYVLVKASFDVEGRMLPMEIVWEDDRKYQIDKILDISKQLRLRPAVVAIGTPCGSGARKAICSLKGARCQELPLEDALWRGRSTN